MKRINSSLYGKCILSELDESTSFSIEVIQNNQMEFTSLERTEIGFIYPKFNSFWRRCFMFHKVHFGQIKSYEERRVNLDKGKLLSLIFIYLRVIKHWTNISARMKFETVVWLLSVCLGVIVVKISPVAGMYGRDKQKILQTEKDVIYSFVSSLSKRCKSWIHCK